MHRLFVAIRPPREIRSRLGGAATGIPHARWQTDEQLHLTLRFIGEVDRHRAEDVAATLGGVHHPAIEFALDGVGQFDRKGRIEALWAAVTPHAPLKALHKKIDQALIRIGLAPEGRAYLPHITIARFGRAAGPIDGGALAVPGLTSGPSLVRDFCLYESTLGSSGATYTIVARYPLG
ncbi:MAG: 2-5 ligase [Sphingomonas bacterium]|nr:2-5 ligase [Sphingomonas bacterium]